MFLKSFIGDNMVEVVVAPGQAGENRAL